MKHYLSENVSDILKKYMIAKEADEGETHGHSGHDSKKAEEIRYDVFEIQFAYNNHETIALLQKRGYAITYLDWKTVEEIDEQLLKMVSEIEVNDDTGEESGKFVELTRPVCAFITFDCDDGKNAALAYSQKEEWMSNSKTIVH